MVQEKLRRAGLLLQAMSELRGHFDAEDQDTLTAMACELIAEASADMTAERQNDAAVTQ